MKKIYFSSFFLFSSFFIFSQETTPPASNNAAEIHGNFQADAQYYNPDSSIGALPVPEKMLMNGFANLIFTKGNFTAGLRFESYLNPMLGFDPRYKGNGIPYRFASYKVDALEITAGNFYEQFGSGMILRAYEEKGLGIDNALDGLRAKYAIHGIYLKGFVGKQRSYFTQGPGIIRGFDGEINLNEFVKSWGEATTKVVLGGSFVSKYQADTDPTYVLPENVGASAGRINISRGKISVGAEYAYKINDPSFDNGYIYRPGEAILLNMNYSKKGLGISLSAKRVDNMSFRSDRNAALSDLSIGTQPALVKQHTYSLFTFYPYSSQPNGEFGYQGELIYKIKKGSILGGKYGTDIAINYSGANGLDTTYTVALYDSSRIGYTINQSRMGDVYFGDFNIEISHKFSPQFKTTLMYANQLYNKDVIQGAGRYGIIYANIGLAELTYQFKPEHSIRMELQHLSSKNAKNSDTTGGKYENAWAQVLVEYTAGEHWYIAALDQYNYGNDNPGKRIHYPNISVGYLKDATRITLGYGKQRQGLFCVGGVCRTVPASNGLTLSITNSF